jgi:hypothetical protein
VQWNELLGYEIKQQSSYDKQNLVALIRMDRISTNESVSPVLTTRINFCLEFSSSFDKTNKTLRLLHSPSTTCSTLIIPKSSKLHHCMFLCPYNKAAHSSTNPFVKAWGQIKKKKLSRWHCCCTHISNDTPQKAYKQ